MRKLWSVNTSAIILFLSAFFTALSLVFSSLGLSKKAVLLNESQILYLFSTTAQVIAAIYGLTLTGYIFFRNELNRKEEFQDEDRVDAIEALKARYFRLLIFITILVGLTIFLANLAISLEGSRLARSGAVVINVGQSAFAASLFAIAYFIFDIIYPGRIEIASQKLQNQLDPSRSDDLGKFLRNYNRIELLLKDASSQYQNRPIALYENRPRRSSNVRLAEILLKNERISEGLFRELRELITLRNSIIHAEDPKVSPKFVWMSEEVLRRLETTLVRTQGDNFEGIENFG